MVEIVVVRCNPIVYDPRVLKIVESLVKKYSLLALGWNRENVPRNIIDNYVVDLKLYSLKAPHGKSILNSPKMGIYYVLYWTWIFFQLVKWNPRVIHACDLDAVIPCYFYKILFQKKLVFDVFDRYAMAFIPEKSNIFYSAISFMEEFFSGRADVLITISEKVLSTFRKRAKHNLIIMNCPVDQAVKKKSNKHQLLRIVYTGDIVSKTRGLESITAAIRCLPNVELVIAGWYMETDKPLIDKISKLPKVKFVGILEPKDALALEASSDVMIGLYTPELSWHNITIPNKLFEAMMCGVPIITNVAPELVKAVGFGILVNYNNVKQVKDAIIALRDNPDLREKLGSNGRKAFVEKYNWPKMEEELFKVYVNLIQ